MSMSGLWTIEHSMLFLEYIQFLFIISRLQTEHFYFSSISVKYSVDTSLGILTNFHFELVGTLCKTPGPVAFQSWDVCCLLQQGCFQGRGCLYSAWLYNVLCQEDIYIWKIKPAIFLVYATTTTFKYFVRAVSFKASIFSCISSSYTHVTYTQIEENTTSSPRWQTSHHQCDNVL